MPAAKRFYHVKSYPSRTQFVKVAESGSHTLLALRPLTGRRHQIRVHLAWIGHAIAGDPLFDKAADGGRRTALHALALAFDAPWRDGQRVEVEAPATPDFWPALYPGALPEHLDSQIRAARLRLEQRAAQTA